VDVIAGRFNRRPILAVLGDLIHKFPDTVRSFNNKHSDYVM
jgi:hypothetical protein